MSRSLKSKLKPAHWLLIISVLILVMAWPASWLAHNRGLAALHRGQSLKDQKQALVWYRVASTLAPHDSRVLIALAKADIAAGRDADALRAATRAVAHGGSRPALILQSQAYLELNQNDQAIASAKKAIAISASGNDAGLQLSLAYAVAGKSDMLSQTIGLMTLSEAAKILPALQHNNFSLAQILYAQGLLNSAQRVLDQHPVENSQYYLLKAQVLLQLNEHSKSVLEQGRGLLEKAVALSPERIDIRRALIVVDNELGDSAAAKEQGIRIKALESGKV